MEFCEICDNILYLRSREDRYLEKHCKHCQFSKQAEGERAIRVTEAIYSEDDLLYEQFQNKYLRFDPTLPRVSDPALVCPQPADKCPGPKDKPRVLYVKYHPTHMKYFFCCDYCGHSFRLNEDKKMSGSAPRI